MPVAPWWSSHCLERYPGDDTKAPAPRERRDPQNKADRWTELARAETTWKVFWASVRTVELTQEITAAAGELASRHSLRGADAVHLASMMALGVDGTLFAVWDQRLRGGAIAEGLPIAPRD